MTKATEDSGFPPPYTHRQREQIFLQLLSDLLLAGVETPRWVTTRGSRKGSTRSAVRCYTEQDFDEILHVCEPRLAALDASITRSSDNEPEQMVFDISGINKIIINARDSNMDSQESFHDTERSKADIAERLHNLAFGAEIGGALNVREQIEAEIADNLLREQRDRLRTISEVAVRAAALEAARSALDEAVSEARNGGATWAEVGGAVGITPQSAMRRWDKRARQKQSDYQRDHYYTPTDKS